jgi:hypothetical protein
VRGVPPPQTPLVQLSPTVQNWPSLQPVPSAALRTTQPLASAPGSVGSQTLVWH